MTKSDNFYHEIMLFINIEGYKKQRKLGNIEAANKETLL